MRLPASPLPVPSQRSRSRFAWLALVLACLCSCKSDPNVGTKGGASQGVAATAAHPTSGGELTFGFDGAAVAEFALDPHKSAFAPHHRIIRSIVDSLVVALPEHRYGPWLAKSWELAADGGSITFKLREDVKFHDGTRFDARAVAFNLDRIKNPKNALIALADIGTYARTVVVDDFTARIEFTRPYAPFLANLSKSSLGMLSPAAVEKYGDAFPSHPVGTGPFRFVSLTAPTEVVLERNPDYRWPAAGAAHDGPAWLERIVFKNVPEESTRVAVLLNGQAGAVDLIPPQNLITLQRAPEYHLASGELLNQNHSLYLNVQREPWRDARAREAFKLSLDIDAAVKTVHLGTQARAWSPLSPSLLGYDKSLEGSWGPDRAKASRILDELGWQSGADGIRVKGGKRLTVVFVDTQGNREKRLDLITIFRRQLQATGIDLRIDSQPGGAYQQKVASGDFDLLAGSLFAPDPDVLRRIHSPEFRGQTSVSKVDDPELNQLLERGYLEQNPDARSAIYARVQRIIIDRTYAIPTYVLNYTVLARDAVQGISIDQHGFPTFYDGWIRRGSS